VQYSGISLFFDEAQYWDWSQHLQWGYYSKPPMIAFLIKLSTLIFGDGVVGVKLLSMLCYLGTALAMVGLSRALWPTSSGVRTGVVAGALFITAPVAGMLGMFASSDAPLLLCWTLAAWALWRAQVTNRIGMWITCGIVCGVGLLSKYTMAAFVITALWTLWGVQGPKRGLLRPGPWLALLAALVVFSPNIVWNTQLGFPTLVHTAEITTRSNRDGGIGSALTFLVGQALMLGPLAVAIGVWLYRKGPQAPMDVAGASQWAASSQMMPPSQWASNSQQASTLNTVSPEAARPKATRSSAYYLASVTSYRYLVALSLPLLVLALGQAFMADAHLNWAAPAMVGLTLLLASRLSQPLIPLAAKRPDNLLWLILASNVLLTAAVVHAHDLLGDKLPSRLDVLVRMRGWHSAFEQLDASLEDPRLKGLPLLTDKRLLAAQASYEWRKHDNLRVMAWNPQGLKQNHYQLQQSMPNTVGQDALVLLDDTDEGDAILSRFAWKRDVAQSAVQVGPDRQVRLKLVLARGFVGYDNATYKEQSGTEGNKSEDTPFTEQKK
jgi:4-amino-4-deoxy-L-arabinose transferase-like glycosyltransferase